MPVICDVAQPENARYSALMAARFHCVVCDKVEERCICDKYCYICQSEHDVRLVEDGCYYCLECREACEYLPEADSARFVD